MKGAQFLILLSSSSPSSIPKPARPFFYNAVKKYRQESGRSHSRLMEERASSTAEEFQKVAEEKAKEAEQGVASQTENKTYEGTEEATIGDSKVDSVKNRNKEHEPEADDRRGGS